MIFVSEKLPGMALDRLASARSSSAESPSAASLVLGEPGRGVRSSSLVQNAPNIRVLVTLLTDRVDEALLATLPALTLVANVAAGVDNIDLAACRARGISVTHTPGVVTEATADFTFALILAACRRVAQGDRLVRRGEFQGFRPALLLGTKVSGSVLGLVGLGRIGRAVAKRARGFGMRVVYTQRTRAPEAVEKALDVRYLPLRALLATCDIVSLHCPLTDETHHLMNAERLASMKLGSVLINTARGACIDEAALVTALREGPLVAAGLDVYEREPTVHPDLLGMDNVVLSPHLGSADTDTREEMGEAIAEEVVAHYAGKSLLHVV